MRAVASKHRKGRWEERERKEEREREREEVRWWAAGAEWSRGGSGEARNRNQCELLLRRSQVARRGLTLFCKEKQQR